MKKWMMGGLVCMAWAGIPGEALAEKAPAQTEVTIDIDKGFNATVTSPAECRIKGQRALKLPISVSPRQSSYDLSDILEYGVECKVGSSDEWRSAKVVTNLAPKISYPFPAMPREYQWSYSGWSWIDLFISQLGLPERCEVSSRPLAAAKTAGTRDQEVGTDKNCQTIHNVRGMAFELGSPIDRGEIYAVYSKTESLRTPDPSGSRITIPVYPCEFDVTGPLPGLVAGVTEQAVDLEASAASPSCRLPPKAAMLHHKGTGRGISTELDPRAPSRPRLKLTDIPADLPAGMQEFELRMAGGLIAIVRANVIPAIKLDKLAVSYNVSSKQDVYGHFGAASGLSKDSIAAVNPMSKLPAAKDVCGGKACVTNVATLSWPSALPAASTTSEANACNSDRYSPDRYSSDREASYFTWKMRPADGWDIVEINDCTHESSSGLSTCDFKGDLGHITFEMKKDVPGPVNALVELHRTELACDSSSSAGENGSQSGTNRGGAEKSTTRTILKMTVPLAGKARIESLPLPARDLLEVMCAGEDLGFWSGEVHAIAENALAEGQCRAQIKNPIKLQGDAQSSLDGLLGLLPLYGPQTLSVVVRRGGAESKQIWQFSPVKYATQIEDAKAEKEKAKKAEEEEIRSAGSLDERKAAVEKAAKAEQERAKKAAEEAEKPGGRFGATSISLDEPKLDVKTDAYYTVEIHPTHVQNIEVVYRMSTATKLDAEGRVASAGELTFSTRLRSRGLFGWNTPKRAARLQSGEYKKQTSGRIYLTAAVLATGVRFPAATTELKDSTSNRYVQYTTPLVGALLTGEPWDYDSGTNPWALNPVIQLGGHFYDTGRGNVGFNPLFGVAATLPLLQEDTPTGSQLGTKATLGVYFEYDTRDSTPHALIALSANIGSLLSGK